MKYSDIKEAMVETFGKTSILVPMITGSPGGGKTALARDVFRSIGIEDDKQVLFRPSLRDPVDLLGTPRNDGEVTRWIPPAEIAQLRKGRWGLLLDELPDAVTMMQNGLCGLIEDRQVGEVHLSPEVCIICTGNRTQDKSGANRMISKLNNRVMYFDFDTNLDDWCEWALAKGISTMLIQFLRFKPGHLDDFKPDNRCNPTPRMWEKVSLVPENLPASIYHGAISGLVGEGVSAEYISFRKLYGKLPNIDEILLHPKTAPMPNKEPGILYALTGALAHRANEDNFNRVAEYIDRMPPEFQVMCVHDAAKLKPDIKNSRSFVDWAVKNANVLI